MYGVEVEGATGDSPERPTLTTSNVLWTVVPIRLELSADKRPQLGLELRQVTGEEDRASAHAAEESIEEG